MADNISPPTSETPPSVEAEVQSRIVELQVQLQLVQGEIRAIEGKIKNRDSQHAAAVEKENQQLRKRLEQLEKVSLGILLESFMAKQASDEKMKYEVLRLGAVQYFQKANLDPEIWKSIAS